MYPSPRPYVVPISSLPPPQDPISIETLYPVNFLCPNGTIFNQELFTCDWW